MKTLYRIIYSVRQVKDNRFLKLFKLNFKFEMEVKSSFSSDSSKQKSSTSKDEKGIGHTLNKGSATAELTGTVASTEQKNAEASSNYKKSNAAKYEINAHAGQLPLPVGVTTIIETYTNAIAPIQLKNSSPESSDPVTAGS